MGQRRASAPNNSGQSRTTGSRRGPLAWVYPLAPTVGIIGAKDTVTVYGWKALAGSVIGYAMDGFDMLILGFMLTAISADLALTSTQRL